MEAKSYEQFLDTYYIRRDLDHKNRLVKSSDPLKPINFYFNCTHLEADSSILFGLHKHEEVSVVLQISESVSVSSFVILDQQQFYWTMETLPKTNKWESTVNLLTVVSLFLKAGNVNKISQILYSFDKILYHVVTTDQYKSSGIMITTVASRREKVACQKRKFRKPIHQIILIKVCRVHSCLIST